MGKCRLLALALLLLCGISAVGLAILLPTSESNAQNPGAAAVALASQADPTVAPTPAISGGLDPADILLQAQSAVDRAGSYRLEQAESDGTTRQLVRTGQVDIATNTLSLIAVDGTSETILRRADLYRRDGSFWTHEESFDFATLDILTYHLAPAQNELISWGEVEILVDADDRYVIHLRSPGEGFSGSDVTIIIDRNTLLPVSIIQWTMPGYTNATSIIVETIYLDYGAPVTITIPREALDELALIPLSIQTSEAGNGWQDVFITVGIDNPTLYGRMVPTEVPYVTGGIAEGYLYSFEPIGMEVFTDSSSPFYQFSLPAGLSACSFGWDGPLEIYFYGQIPIDTTLTTLDAEGFASLDIPTSPAQPNCIPDAINSPDIDDSATVGLEEHGDNANIRVDSIDRVNEECCWDSWYFRTRIENLNPYQNMYVDGLEFWAIDSMGMWIASWYSNEIQFVCSFEDLKYSGESIGPNQIRGETLCFPNSYDDQLIVAVVVMSTSTNTVDVVPGMPVHWWEVFPRIWERFR